MLPGLSGLAGRVGSLPVITVFYKDYGALVAPPGYTSARVTIFAAGGDNLDGSGDAGGGGGGCSQSTIQVTPGEQLFGRIHTNISTSLRRGSDQGPVLVSAANGGRVSNLGAGGNASDGVGNIRFSGGSGLNGRGGGAAGTQGDGASGATGSRGPGMTFVQTSNGEIARNADGAGYGGAGLSYGGGAGAYSGAAGGLPIIIIEWGFGQ